MAHGPRCVTDGVQIRTPSGRTVTAHSNCRIFNHNGCSLSLSVCVHPEDSGFVEGLCGNYNGIREDDIIPRGHTDPDPNYIEPNYFTASYL